MLVKRSAFAEAADWQRIAAEAPRAQAEPAEVFHCVAAMRKFPVEHAAQSLLIHQQIAGAKITVNNARQRWCRQIGRAHVRTTVTNAQLVCRLLPEQKKKHQNTTNKT